MAERDEAGPDRASERRLNLVTGACGFAGSHTVKKLLDAGEEVVATDLPRAFEHPKVRFIAKNIGLNLQHARCRVVPADLLDEKSLGKVFPGPITHVFHTASLYDYSAPLALLSRINVDGSRNLFERASKHEGLKRFVHWSTCGVFGKPYTASEGSKCNLPFVEDACSTPRNAPYGQPGPTGTHLVNNYSITKWQQEQLAWKYHRERGLPLTVVRPAPLYGPGSDYGHGGILLAVNKGLVPLVPTDAKNYISTSVHVEDIVGFSLYIAGHVCGLGEDYNVVDDSIISYCEFMHYLALLLGRRMRDVPFINLRRAQPVMVRLADLWCRLEERYGVPRIRVFEASSATYMSSSYWLSNKKSKETGYLYRYPDVREGMRDTVDWFRRVGWLDRSYNPKGAWKDYVPSAPDPLTEARREK